MKKFLKLFGVALALYVGFILLNVGAFHCLNIPIGDDAGELTEIASTLERIYPEPIQVGGTPLRRSTSIVVFEVVDKPSQDLVIEILREEQKKRDWKPIKISFIREHVMIWTEHPNGNRSGRRGEEELLRKEWIR